MSAHKNKKKFDLNLLIRQDVQPKILDNLFHWILNSGKYIVIFVEFIVIVALIARYRMDTEIRSLNDEINSQVAYIKSLKNDEVLIRKTHFQITNIKNIKQESIAYKTKIEAIASLTPANIILSNISFDSIKAYPRTSTVISGRSRSVLEISAFLKSLQQDDRFSDEIITSLAREEDLTLFTINAMLNTQAGGTN